MILTFNRKMMMAIPGEGDSPGPITDADALYENADIEQDFIDGFAADDSSGRANSPTLNITNFLNDYGMVMGNQIYRTSEKESKGAENLANGKPRYYPAAYVEAMKENPASSVPVVNPPADPDPVDPIQ